ncbi:MAG: FAD-dependent oxidoreductase [Thermomicrobia bacterium]|nr:FAD-dependent oxidoreductase [Thermomicrobia bacterium]
MQQFYDLVVGGDPAGITAAIYAAREGISTLVVERSSLGGQAAITERLDNYPGFPDGVTGEEFRTRLVAHAHRFGVELLSAQEVTDIGMDGSYRCLALADGTTLTANAVLLAPGSTYQRLGIPGEEDFLGAGIHFCATCDGPFYRDQEVLVIGVQTSMPGLFAAGDARVGSTKQVASAAGEGTAAALAIRTYLQHFGEEGRAMREPSAMIAD